MRPIFAVGVGAALAALINGLIFGVLVAAGYFGPSTIAVAAGRSLALGPVVMVSAGAVVGAGLMRTGLELILVPRMARWGFWGLSGLVLVASFIGPIRGLSGQEVAEIVALEVMHVVTAGLAVAAVEWGHRPRWGWGAEPYHERDDLEPRTAMVTGATSGIGAAVAVALVWRGFEVIGVGRSADKAQRVAARVEGAPGRLIMIPADLSSMAECERVAREANAIVGVGFGAVVHCVGTLTTRSSRTSEGIDQNIATSWLSRVRLWSLIERAPGVRLVNVGASERGQVPSFMQQELRQVEDLKTGMRAHGQAQLANDLWVAALSRRGVSAFGYGPGAVDTSILRAVPVLVTMLLRPLFWAQMRAPDEAALDIVRLVLDRDLSHGFASREGLFEHDAFVLDASRQDFVLGLAQRLVASV